MSLHICCPVQRDGSYQTFALCHEGTRVICATLLCAVKRGDRIAQLILERIVTPEVVEVDDLEATVRGSGGFGSTGVSIVG